MILPTNMVCVRPDEDILSDNTGLVRRDFAEKHLLKAVTGTVIGVCDRLFFAERRPGIRPEAAQLSMEVDVPIEIKVGDRVVFNYIAAVDEDMQVNGDYIISYDQIYARIEPGNAEFPLYPLNGYLLVDPFTDEDEVGGVMVRKEDVAKWNFGRVVAEGCMVARYRDGHHPDVMTDMVGQVVAYPSKRAVRIEGDDTKQFGAGRWSLYRLHRRHIQFMVV